MRISGAQWQGVARQQVQPAKRGAFAETAAGGHHRQQVLMAIADVLTADVEPIMCRRAVLDAASTDAQESMCRCSCSGCRARGGRISLAYKLTRHPAHNHNVISSACGFSY